MKHEDGAPTDASSNYGKEESEDIERQQDAVCPTDMPAAKESAFKNLGWLDRLLALWILLAMMTGILLGNFVDSVGPVLQKGEFVGVSIPIGTLGKDRSLDVRVPC